MDMMSTMPPDMSAVGNAATASKAATGGGKELTSFSVKKGDNGGVIICETREAKPPAGRRASASFPPSSDYLENPYGPNDLAAAAKFATGLFVELGGPPPAPEPESPAEDQAEGMEEPGEPGAY